MLTHIARHGLLHLAVQAAGDLHIDDHHTVEDVGIALGQALREAVGDKVGITRYGHVLIPMDEALVVLRVRLERARAIRLRFRLYSAQNRHV